MKNQKGFTPILAIIFIALVIGGYFVYQRQATPGISQPAPSPATDETANWKTYTNKDYGFSFKYPAEITPFENEQTRTVHLQYKEKLSQNSPDGYELAPGYMIDFGIGDLGDNDLKSFVENEIKETTTQLGGTITKPLTMIKVGVYSGFTYSSTVQVESTHIILPNKNNSFISIYYVINDKNSRSYQAEVDQILSTFKFTD